MADNPNSSSLYTITTSIIVPNRTYHSVTPLVQHPSNNHSSYHGTEDKTNLEGWSIKKKYSRQKGGEQERILWILHEMTEMNTCQSRCDGVGGREVEQEEDRSDSLHSPFLKGRLRQGRRIIASNSYSSVERITLQAICEPEMIYTRNEPIWDCLFCSLRSGMHNRELFVIHDCSKR